MPDFIPHKDTELVLWLQTHVTRLDAHASALGLTPQDVAQVGQLCQDIIGPIREIRAARATLASIVARKEATKAAGLKELRRRINRLRVLDAMTPAIAVDLGLGRPSRPGDLDQLRPEFRAVVLPGCVRLEWRKGAMEGVNFYVRRPGEGAWRFLARDTVSPYEDRTPLAAGHTAETREYMARAVVHDAEVGQASEIIAAVFAG